MEPACVFLDLLEDTRSGCVSVKLNKFKPSVVLIYCRFHALHYPI